MTIKDRIVQTVLSEYDGIVTVVELTKVHVSLGNKAKKPSFSYLTKDESPKAN